MNAFASYLRHLFVTGILLLVEKLKLPVEGAEDAANFLALAAVGTLSWLFAKYVAPHLAKKSGVALFALSAALALGVLPSCANSGGSGPSAEQLDAGYQLLKLFIEPTK